MKSDFNILIDKLHAFIRKYYKNQMIRGAILSVALILTMFLLVDVFEFLSWNSSRTRAVIFYSFIVLAVFILVFYLIIPFLKLYHIGKSLSEAEAAEIIGAHFPEVKDKLLNTLQLQAFNRKAIASGELDLLLASIRQKSADLKPVPFKRAIDYSNNYHYLKFAAPPLLIILLIIFIYPAFITEPSHRILLHSTHFEKPLPYQLTITNKVLEVLQRDDFSLNVKAEGEVVPSMIFVQSGNNKFMMRETAPGNFTYTFKNLKGDIYFNLLTDEMKSEKFRIKVIPKPVIFNFSVNLNYPSYLNKKNEVIENAGDLIVPEGTIIEWQIFTRDTRTIIFKADNESLQLTPTKANHFRFSRKATKNFFYTLLPANEFVSGIDSLQFSVQVIKDEYPGIKMGDFNQKALHGFIHFNGEISDDHGFHSLRFFFQKDSTVKLPYKWQQIPVDADVTQQYFNYSIRTNDFGLLPGNGMTYYFEVRDNDRPNGFKRTKSTSFYLKMPDFTEIEASIDHSSDSIKNSLKDALKDMEEIDKQLEQARLSMFEKKELSWMDKQNLAELLKKEASIREQIDQMKKLNEEINELEEQIEKKADPELLKKMKELQEMFADLMDEEMKKKLEDMQKELDKMNKDQLSSFLEEMKKKNEEMKTSLEQNLELFKEMEFQKKFQEAVDQLKELAEKQKDLAEKTAGKEMDKKEAIDKQQDINEAFKLVEEKLEKADKLNEELNEPFNVETDSAAMEDIQSDLNEANSKLQKGKQKKAAQSQQSAGDKMDKMASDLNAMMQGAQMDRLAEDAQQVKNMLDNLLDLSFTLEHLSAEIGNTAQNDPNYVKQSAELKDISDDFKIVHDSLVSLSKRQPAIKSFLTRESAKVNKYLDVSIKSMQERRKGNALGQQQYAMTSMNNLALMLAESLDQMKQSMQMQSEKSGKGKCKNPGQGAPSLQEMMQMQQQMNSGMKSKAEKKGLNGKNGLNGQSKDLARMAAMQGEIRRRLQNYIEELERNGVDGSALSTIAEEMEKTEEDIINRKISQQTLERQKQLEVRLMKSEKAEQEREKQKKRESEAGKNRKRGNLNNDLKYNLKKENQQEILLLSPIEMSPYYRALLNKYLYKLEQENDKQ